METFINVCGGLVITFVVFILFCIASNTARIAEVLEKEEHRNEMKRCSGK